MSLRLKTVDGKPTFFLQSHQIPIVNCEARTLAVFAGVQSGKTVACAARLAKLVQDNPGKKFGITAPNLPHLKRVPLAIFIDIIRLWGLVEGKEENWHNKTEKVLFFANGAKVYYVGAEDPESLQGLTLKAFWADEAQLLDVGENAIPGRTYEVMKQRTTVERGQVIISGLIPNPSELAGHWLYEEVFLPSQKGDKDFVLFQFHSTSNIFFSPKEYEKEKRRMPPDEFAAQYEGRVVKGFGRNNLIPIETLAPAHELWRKQVVTLPERLLVWARNHQPAYLELPLPQGGGDERLGECVDIAADVARTGGDRNVFTLRFQGIPITQLDIGGQREDETADYLMLLGRELLDLGYNVRYWIDMPGIGAGIFDILYGNGQDVQEYHPQMNPRETNGIYLDAKAESGWNLRRNLINNQEPLPPISRLDDDLVKYRYKYRKGKLVIVDPAKSPDYGDSYLVSIFAKDSFLTGSLLLGLD